MCTESLKMGYKFEFLQKPQKLVNEWQMHLQIG